MTVVAACHQPILKAAKIGPMARFLVGHKQFTARGVLSSLGQRRFCDSYAHGCQWAPYMAFRPVSSFVSCVL
jgi:hypothetical protein